jgi:hypothetical protein
MPLRKAKGAEQMAITEKRREWLKENTVFIGLRLQKSTDAAILDYLEGKAKQTVIKAALKEYIDNHKND